MAKTPKVTPEEQAALDRQHERRAIITRELIKQFETESVLRDVAVGPAGPISGHLCHPIALACYPANEADDPASVTVVSMRLRAIARVLEGIASVRPAVDADDKQITHTCEQGRHSACAVASCRCSCHVAVHRRAALKQLEEGAK